MAEQIPFSVIASVLLRLGTSSFQEIGYAYGVAQELTAIKPKLDILNGVLVDTEENQVESHAVQAWLRRLKDVVYDADDLLDDIATNQLQRGGVARQVSDFFSSSNQVVFRYKMSNKVKQIKKEVDEIVNQIPPMLNIIQGNGVHGVGCSCRDTHGFALGSEIVGRKETKEEIVKLLLSSDDEETLSMVAIVGIGGLGKTTLAQLVYNDMEVVKHFQPRIWVCVSDNFDVRALIIKILKDIREQDVEKLELNGLKDLLHKKLSQKRCLLVLDDVWNENGKKWDQFKSVLLVVGEGSKILVTTRKSYVASIMGIDSPFVLEGLNEAQSWDLFSKITLKNKPNELEPKLIRIGREIVNMCKGVPLVIKMLGTILRSKIEESWWLYIRNNKNLLCLEPLNDIVLSVFKLSYNNLPSYLKQCFTYCALFPKGYEIEKKELVQIWMAQGYIHPSDKEVGDQYFAELLSRSLLEEFRRDGSNNILSCKMHDLIHDLAQSLMGYEILILEDGVKEIAKGVRHVSFYEPKKMELLALNGKHIRTLLSIGGDYRVEDYLNLNFKYLRVLSLKDLYLIKLPKALGKLNHLRYLDLSHNDFVELPNSITRLKNLQTLKLFGCKRLKIFPKDIRELINMRHWENDKYLRHMPYGIRYLTLLQSLPIFVVGNGRGIGRLNELQGLNNLRGELRIVKLQNARYATVGCVDANLRAKEYIQSLRLEWEYTEEEQAQWGEDDARWGKDMESLMEGLQPPPNLVKLHVSGYGGVRFPYWGMMNGGLSDVLPNLTTLHLERWSRCQTLPCLVGLPLLKCLELRDFKVMKKMDCSSKEPFFPSLKTLTLHHMPNLKGMWRRDLPTNTPPSYSCLSQMKISYCDNLASLELHSSPLLSSLFISSCPNLTSLQLPPSPRLSQLEIQHCLNLASLQLHSSPLLSSLFISYCPMLTSLLLPPSPSLSHIGIWHCQELVSSNLPSLPCLEELNLQGVKEFVVRGFILLATGSSFKSVSIQSIKDLTSLPDELRQHVSTLQSIKIQKCPRLATLPDWISDDTALDIGNCSQLRSLPEESSEDSR